MKTGNEPVFRRNAEIWYSLGAMVAVTALYFVVSSRLGALPAASGFVGHSIGIVGIILMLTTEVAYSIRKRSDLARWGSMAAWLRFHIFTGLVGPYMVLLHTAMHFRGLAGVSMLMTAVVVGSGVTGRYIYTRAPHRARASATASATAVSGLSSPARPPAVAQPSPGVLAAAGAAPATQSRSGSLAYNAPDAHASVARASGVRSSLAVWRAMHVPLTWVLFATAFAHVVAALYYATLQR